MADLSDMPALKSMLWFRPQVKRKRRNSSTISENHKREIYKFAALKIVVFSPLLSGPPNSPIVRTVLTRMVEGGTYLFLAINPNGSVTVFNADVGQDSGSNLAGLKSNRQRILSTRYY
jgi:hypothetical protein